MGYSSDKSSPSLERIQSFFRKSCTHSARHTKTAVLWIGGDVADNPAWHCTETRCSYSVQQRGGLRQDDDCPGWPRHNVFVSPHVLKHGLGMQRAIGRSERSGLRGW
jgi:hypothetical protein